VFAFANRTYAPASKAVRDAANLLVRSGAYPPRPLPPGDALRAMLAAAAHVYETGDVMAEPDAYAMNFFLDRDASLRNADIAALKQTTGECRPPAAPRAESALSGTFEFTCERGSMRANLILAPTAKPTLQKLEFVP
jgi:serine-type D-Ala-D-Ala carboxypeptidase/endopeptidase